MDKYLQYACDVSRRGNKIRRAFLGAVGIRSDGTIVYSYNGHAEDKKPTVHAEARLARKLDPGSIVYVARTDKIGENVCMAKPCKFCKNRLKFKGVKKVYYTISGNEYGTIEFYK